MKRIYLYSIFLIIIGCISKTKNENISSKKKEIVNYQPLFLSLSPNMSDSIFRYQIKELNKHNKLEKNQFALPVNDRYYYFDVTKDKYSIYLSYSKKKEYGLKHLNYKISDEIMASYKNQALEFKKIFDKRYKNTIKQIPNNIYVEDYPSYNMNYILYNDIDKYILLGYRVRGHRIGNEKESEQRMDDIIYQITGRHIDKNDKEELRMKKYLKATSSGPTTADFGFDIKINYFYKNYIDSLIVEMKINNKEIEKNNLKLQRKNNRINEIRKNNINEL
jgi:hypothetical protein